MSVLCTTSLVLVVPFWQEWEASKFRFSQSAVRLRGQPHPGCPVRAGVTGVVLPRAGALYARDADKLVLKPSRKHLRTLSFLLHDHRRGPDRRGGDAGEGCLALAGP
jgi:hypothetical protein